MATRENRYIIRLAGEADGAGLTGLFAQLGYPNPDGAVSARLARVCVGLSGSPSRANR